MRDADIIFGQGIIMGLALLSGDRKLIRLCEIAFSPTMSHEEPPKVIEWIR